MRAVQRARVVVLVLLGVVYPIASYAFPSIGRAWGMYTSTSMYRLELTGVDASGTRVAIPLDSVIHDASPRVATALVGAEQGRHGSVLSLPSQLALVGRHACRSGLREIEVELEWRASEGGEDQTESTVVSCPP